MAEFLKIFLINLIIAFIISEAVEIKDFTVWPDDKDY